MTLTRIIAFSVAFGSAVFVLKHAHTFKLANEVVDELSKVSWPSREETGNATIVVLVAVLICSVYLGIFDAIWLSLTNFILGVNPS
ncbi:MAG: preprotein translocase subunit SecE [Deltaproteobacteria bacterium]|nr:preprotein translocase subunit SecE [Deltaproteobacteria bacterium]